MREVFGKTMWCRVACVAVVFGIGLLSSGCFGSSSADAEYKARMAAVMIPIEPITVSPTGEIKAQPLNMHRESDPIQEASRCTSNMVRKMLKDCPDCNKVFTECMDEYMALHNNPNYLASQDISVNPLTVWSGVAGHSMRKRNKIAASLYTPFNNRWVPFVEDPARKTLCGRCL